MSAHSSRAQADTTAGELDELRQSAGLDALTRLLSRHGGDEFLILLAELQQPADAAMVADKLVAALAEPATVEGRPVQLSASIGMAVYPGDGEDLDTLTARADASMYARKRARARVGAPIAESAPPASSTGSLVSRPPGPAAADDAARRLAELCGVNEQLLLSALGAQALRDAAEQARQRQAAFMDAVTEELRNPMAPIRIATTMLGRLPGEAPLLPRVRRPTLQRHRLRLSWQPRAAPIDVVGSVVRLEQIVANLLDNACTHTPDGGASA